MSKFAKLGDDLMKVPKLDIGGTNWVVYKDRFLWSINVHSLLEHVDSSEGEPECPVVTRYTAAKNAEGEDTGEDHWCKSPTLQMSCYC
jgi:hypothetical protein